MAGPQCCANPPTLDPNSGRGHVEEFGGLKNYVTGSPDSKTAILLISDIFGFEAPNIRMVADKVSATGFYVVVPDFFYGDPFVYDKPDRPLMVWLKDHGMDKGFEDAKLVIDALKSKGISAIGAAGMCWGAKVVVEVSKLKLIQAAALLHPSFVSVDDIKGIKVPIVILGAEFDQYSPPELVTQFKDVLTAANPPQVDCYVKIFDKAVHGWTVRYDVDDEDAVKAADEAHAILLDWFTKYVLLC